MKLKFPTKWSSRERIFSNPGQRVIDVFSSKMLDDGSIEVTVTGKKDLYDEIQSHRLSVDMKTLLMRYESGDVTALEKMTGQYMDISEMPNNLIHVLKTVDNAKNQFEQLPIEAREAYDFDVNKFVADIGSEKWMSLMFPHAESQPIDEKIESEVVADE